MQSIDSIEQAVNELRAVSVPFALLECTNLYPSPPEIVSLKGVTELKDAYPDAIVGFSDHSIGSEMALAAVALGASIIERHFTDTRYRAGPDISCSSDPAELRKLISILPRFTRLFTIIKKEVCLKKTFIVSLVLRLSLIKISKKVMHLPMKIYG